MTAPPVDAFIRDAHFTTQQSIQFYSSRARELLYGTDRQSRMQDTIQQSQPLLLPIEHSLQLPNKLVLPHASMLLTDCGMSFADHSMWDTLMLMIFR